ncbi:L,D-transpeptidase [Prosthecobacter sp.]|uniref:L,D-transpeptidase n=1 Tax=Prosthecobacter sp. TaxID=1965333 RepID=UPI003783C804
MMLLRLLLLFQALSFVSCTTVKTTSSNAFHYSRHFVTREIPRASRFVWKGVTGLFGPGDRSFWDADDMHGKPSVVINLSEQMVYLFKNGQLAGGSPISSGAEGYDTRPGRYHVMEKDIDHKSSIYGDYEDYHGNVVMQNINNRTDPRPPGTRFEGAKMYYFMRIYGGVGMHQGYLPGYAASHGCIRLPGHMAEKFYAAVPKGTPVEVVP